MSSPPTGCLRTPVAVTLAAAADRSRHGNAGRSTDPRRRSIPMASVDPPARKGLPPEAYEVVPGSEYRPYVPASRSLAEFTVKAVVVGILWRWSSGPPTPTYLYLGLRVGLMVSASIPAAVMAVAIFRALHGPRGLRERPSGTPPISPVPREQVPRPPAIHPSSAAPLPPVQIRTGPGPLVS